MEFHRGIALPACAHTLSLAVLWIDAVRDGPSQNPRQRPSTVWARPANAEAARMGGGALRTKPSPASYDTNYPHGFKIKFMGNISPKGFYVFAILLALYFLYFSPSSFLHAAYFAHPTESEMKVKPRPRDVK